MCTDDPSWLINERICPHLSSSRMQLWRVKTWAQSVLAKCLSFPSAASLPQSYSSSPTESPRPNFQIRLKDSILALILLTVTPKLDAFPKRSSQKGNLFLNNMPISQDTVFFGCSFKTPPQASCLWSLVSGCLTNGLPSHCVFKLG